MFSLNFCLHWMINSTTFGNMPCMVLSYYNIVKKFFFSDRTEWCSFHKLPDFSCSRCVKRVFYSAFVWKCTYKCNHRFGVQLFQNPPLWSSTEGLMRGCKGIIICFSLTYETFRFSESPAVALLNYQRSSNTFADFYQRSSNTFADFSPNYNSQKPIL